MGDLTAQTKVSRATILRAIDSKRIPEAEFRTPGGHRRWSVRAAVAIVESMGRTVPAAWRKAAKDEERASAKE